VPGSVRRMTNRRIGQETAGRASALFLLRHEERRPHLPTAGLLGRTFWPARSPPQRFPGLRIPEPRLPTEVQKSDGFLAERPRTPLGRSEPTPNRQAVVRS